MKVYTKVPVYTSKTRRLKFTAFLNLTGMKRSMRSGGRFS